jgi:hypothetical protein
MLQLTSSKDSGEIGLRRFHIQFFRISAAKSMYPWGSYCSCVARPLPSAGSGQGSACDALAPEPGRNEISQLQ